VKQPTTQVEVLVMNTSAPNIVPPPPHQHQTIKTQEDLQQDSEEEIKAVIEDELVHLRQENERLCLMQEHLTRWKTMVKRSQIMQQQIEQERATQAELQRAIEDLLLARAWTLNARASATVATTTAASTPESTIAIVETNTGHCWQQVPLGR
jgi:hypothetical protein